MSSVRSKVEIGAWGARYYDILLNLLSLGRYAHFMKEVIEKMNIQPGHAILDLGSGTGRNHCLMAHKIGPQGKIAGLDISDAMLRRALKRCSQYANIGFNKERIELPLSYKVGIIRNAYQALKPGGDLSYPGLCRVRHREDVVSPALGIHAVGVPAGGGISYARYKGNAQRRGFHRRHGRVLPQTAPAVVECSKTLMSTL